MLNSNLPGFSFSFYLSESIILEQERAIKRIETESPAVEHHLEHHSGESPEFSMKLVEFSPFPLQRQAKEGHLITNFKGDVLMNRKGDWGQNLPPRLIVEGEEERTGGQRTRVQERKKKEEEPERKKSRTSC